MTQPDLAAAVCLMQIYITLNMHCSGSRAMVVRDMTCQIADAPPL